MCFVEHVVVAGQNVIINEICPLQEHYAYLCVFITVIVVGAIHECA